MNIKFSFLFLLFFSSNLLAQWQIYPLDVNDHLYSIYFLDEDHGWISGANGAVLQTVDGGNTWTILNRPTSNNLFSIFFVNPQKGWVLQSNTNKYQLATTTAYFY